MSSIQSYIRGPTRSPVRRATPAHCRRRRTTLAARAGYGGERAAKVLGYMEDFETGFLPRNPVSSDYLILLTQLDPKPGGDYNSSSRLRCRLFFVVCRRKREETTEVDSYRLSAPAALIFKS